MEQFCNDLWLSHGLADKTIAAYRADLIGFSSWLSGHNGKTLLQAQILDIDEWLASLLERKISPRSVARYSASLRRFYRYLASNELVSQDPTVPLGKIKIPFRLPNTPTQDEVSDYRGASMASAFSRHIGVDYSCAQTPEACLNRLRVYCANGGFATEEVQAFERVNHFAPVPVAVYGVVLLMAAIAYWILQRLIVKAQGPDSLLRKAIGSDWKGRLSPLLYALAIVLAVPQRGIAIGLYVLVALLWLVPDRRIERVLPREPD